MTTARLTKELTARSSRTVEKIEAAALQAITMFGRDRFTTHDIATLSGVSIGTVYRYFPDRIAILNRVAPIPPNAVDAVNQIDIALESLERYPVYEPKGLRQALLTAREMLSTGNPGAGASDVGGEVRRRRAPARAASGYSVVSDADAGLAPGHQTH